jgi:hypothetical protein
MLTIILRWRSCPWLSFIANAVPLTELATFRRPAPPIGEEAARRGPF